MGTYKYTALDRTGIRQQGQVSGVSQQEARNKVKAQGLRLLHLSPELPRSTVRDIFKRIQVFPRKIETTLLILFFRQLATLLGAGIQLVDALEILEQQVHGKNKFFAGVIRQLIRQVQAGTAFSAALGEHTRTFPGSVVAMVRAAEAGGDLDRIIAHIAGFLEKDHETRKMIKSAVSYPKFVGGFFGLILTGIIFGLLPKFENIFAGFGADLPVPTMLILNSSNFIKDNFLVLTLLLVAILAGFRVMKKSPAGRLLLDKYYFYLPVAGPLLQESVITRFMLTLSILLKSGVGLIDSFKIASETAANKYLELVISVVSREVSAGQSFGKLLSGYPLLFTPLTSNMVAIGEKSGALALMLEKVADYNDREFSSKIQQLTHVLEPVIMAGLGIVATIVVLGLYLPIFKLSGSIH